jgi:transposase
MDQDITVGLDLGDQTSELCVLGGDGQVQRRLRVKTTAPALTKTLSALPACRVVLEVGTHSPWVSRLVTQLGHEAIVANPRKVRLIGQNEDKSDRVDAELLARLGRADPQLLRPIRHRGEQAQRDRALLSVRDGLVRARVALINQARGQAKALGMRLPRCTTQGFASRLRKEGLVSAYPGLEHLVEPIAQLTQRIGALDREIETLCETRYPETALLRQIPGVGSLTALTFVLTLEDPRRFRRSRQVGAYLGLRPKRRQSGKDDPQLRITKAGDPFLRRLLVQSAHYILGPYGPDTDLRRFGERLIARGGRGARKKARVAVARKLAVLLHRLWVSGEVYEPLRHAEASAAA